LMLSVYRPLRASRAWRAIYVVCTLLVFSYILFEVLDLDGSSFPLEQYPLDRTAIVAEVAKDTARAYSVERTERWLDLSTLSPGKPREAMWLTRALTFSSLNFGRTRGYRIALPRSSPSDPFHSL
jgi:hypothetical protein